MIKNIVLGFSVILISSITYAGSVEDISAARALLKQKEFVAAETAYQNILVTYTNINPKTIAAIQADLINIYMATKQYDEAIDICLKNTNSLTDQSFFNCLIYQKKYDVIIDRFLSGPSVIALPSYQKFQKIILDQCVILAKNKLRGEGKSFLTKDGTNPVQVLVKPVEVAINAPGWDGFEAAYRNLNGTVSDIDRGPATEQVNIITNEALTAGIPQTANLGKVLFLLGTENYNKFVQQYNSN